MLTVYALCEPGTDTVRYVGITKKHPQHRLWEHDYTARRGSRYQLYDWLRALQDAGSQPELIVLEVTDAPEQEAHWIQWYRAAGADLLNRGQNMPISDERRERHRQARLRVLERDGPSKHTEASKAKLSAALQGNKNGSGHPVSAAAREKIGAARRGKPRPPEVREKLRQASLADHARRRAEKRAEMRRKMSEAAMGNKNATGARSEEQKMKMRGKKRSAESCQRIAEAARATWARRKAAL